MPVIQKTPHVTPRGTPTAAATERRAARGMPLLAGLSYCSASAGMVLLNKLVLSTFDFHSYTVLLIAQCIFCLVAVRIASAIRIVQLEVRSPQTPPPPLPLSKRGGVYFHLAAYCLPRCRPWCPSYHLKDGATPACTMGDLCDAFCML